MNINLKKRAFLALALLTFTLLSGCKEREQEYDINFDYPIEELYGAWSATEVYTNGAWYALTTPELSSLAFSVTFNTNLSYSFTQEGGSVSGTYWPEGKMVECFDNQGLFEMFFNFTSLSATSAEVTLRDGVFSTQYRLTKR